MPKRKSDETKEDRWLRKKKKYEDKLNNKRKNRIIYSSDEDDEENADHLIMEDIPIETDSCVEIPSNSNDQLPTLPTPDETNPTTQPDEEVDMELLQTLGELEPEAMEWGEDVHDNIAKRHELEALYGMYRRLVAAAQAAVPTSAIDPPPKTEGIDQSTFRSVMHSTLGLVTEEAVLERLWVSWERGAAGGEGALRFDPWARGLSVLLRGSPEERRRLCFNVYDLNADGYITKDEMFQLLKNSLLKQPGDEDPDEGVRDLVELVLRKLDADKDGRVSLDDYREAVEQEPLLLEAFGQCLPSKRHAAAFLRTLVTNNNNK